MEVYKNKIKTNGGMIYMDIEQEIKDIKKVVSFLYGSNKLLFAKETNQIINKWNKELGD